jgi:predicted TPR repeat methyltransferase
MSSASRGMENAEKSAAFSEHQIGILGDEYMRDWNAGLYDNKHDFVSEYGQGLLEFVPRNKNQSILDLGCGTGTLTSRLSDLADSVIGVDCSASMLAKAREKYPNIQFMVCDAL